MVIKTPNLLTTLFLIGSCGGIVATFQRLKNVPADSHHFKNPVSNNLAIIQVYTSPLVAGIFSLVLMLFFVSGALEGFMTPNFIGGNGNFTSVREFLISIKPSGNVDVAKCYTWCFIAGYSEKIIPTILDKMALEPK